ncbi:HAD hydrolase, subfamily IA [Trema orientale]|uniref:HAD hydrolase, subfamily IA n=1 Tax=Trema orientale TaxID=63057 RepID=A0A2P5EPV8_TREOI|nr:HAD hydrolase, subfamily IA [Trema orientale]
MVEFPSLRNSLLKILVGTIMRSSAECFFLIGISREQENLWKIRKACSGDERGLKRAAVTNAPRPNVDLIISMLDLSSFFKIIVLGNECERAKPFPDPYLKGLQALEVSHEHTFVFEDSVSGVKAGVAAGVPVVGLGTRNPEKSLLDAGASFVIKDFDDPKLWTALGDF